MNIAINMQVAFVLAVTAGHACRAAALDGGQTLSEANKDKAQLQQTIEKETLAGFLYTYRSLTDADIER